MDCGAYAQQYGASAVQQGNLSQNLTSTFSVRMRFGLFNGNTKELIYGKLSPSQVCKKKNKNLALEAAREGIVLLKNSANFLPLAEFEDYFPRCDWPTCKQFDVRKLCRPPCASIFPRVMLKSRDFCQDARM